MLNFKTAAQFSVKSKLEGLTHENPNSDRR